MDQDIEQLLQAGEYDGAFDLLVERFRERVFRLAWSYLRNATHAEDAAQDVFVRIWKALPNFRGNASFSTWIYTITRNVCLTELKRRAARPTVSLDAQAGDMDQIPERSSTEREMGAAMDARAMLAQLPENYRRATELFYLEQKAYDEAAAMMGIPIGTMKTLLFRARKELLRIASHPVERASCPLPGMGQKGYATPIPIPARLVAPKITPIKS
jgi:RNA polymerase sigma-70 factor (ECF subfamily)